MMPKTKQARTVDRSTDTRERMQMADLARMAGVSTSTVSRALSGSPLVKESTRARIAKLADAHHYALNVGARNLRLGQSRTVAVVVPYDAQSKQRITDPFFLGLLGSIADALTDREFDMLLSRVDAEHLDSAARLVDSGRALGIILIGQWHHHDQLNGLASRRVPLVVWGARLAAQRYPSVGGDNVLGGELATAHLLARGRRRIAFIGDVALPEVAQRYEGHVAALRKKRFRASPELCLRAAFTAASGRETIEALLASGVRFDAIFACSDLLAMTAINTLQRAGLCVPDDIAVVGYDDIELATHFHPALSTVRQPLELAGHALVEALLARIAGKRPKPTVLPTALVVRASSDTTAD